MKEWILIIILQCLIASPEFVYRSRPQIYRLGVHEEVGHKGEHHPYHCQSRHNLQDWTAEIQGKGAFEYYVTQFFWDFCHGGGEGI